MEDSMNLAMQGAHGMPQNLPGHDNLIVTGPMGDCVSVVVLYNYNGGNNQYGNARGWHGLGGIQVINMAAMLMGVPNNPMTQVIVIPGSLQQSNYARQQNLQYVQGALAGGHAAVNLRYIGGRSNATVNRQGQVT